MVTIKSANKLLPTNKIKVCQPIPQSLCVMLCTPHVIRASKSWTRNAHKISVGKPEDAYKGGRIILKLVSNKCGIIMRARLNVSVAVSGEHFHKRLVIS